MISTIVRPRWVIRPPPIRPGPRMPFITRAGQAEAPIEPGALDRALEALALRLAGDLDLLADLEGLDRDGLADEQFARVVAELHDVAVSRGVGLLEMAELSLGQHLLLARAERELHGLVAVALLGANGGHRTGAGLEHGDALDTAVIEEPLGHPELLGEDRCHG
jgi:hypothetical protein